MGGMAPPQVIISQPQPDNSNNSLLTSFITSKLLNESMNQNRTNITNAEQSSYFNARESIIPKLPETPITKPVVIKYNTINKNKNQRATTRTRTTKN